MRRMKILTSLILILVVSLVTTLMPFGATISKGISNAVTIYTNTGFEGRSVDLAVGDYTREDLAAKGIEDNTVSSVKVSSGYKAILYSQNNFRGTSLSLKTDLINLRKVNFNKRLTSLRVLEADRAVGANGTRPSVKPSPLPEKTSTPVNQATGNNMVLNPSFSAQVQNWGTGWGGTQLESSNVHSANYALKVGPASGGVYQMINGLKADKSYKLSAWGKVDTLKAPGLVILYLYDANNAVLSTYRLDFSESLEYTYKELTFVAPATIKNARVDVWKFAGSGDEYFYCDDVFLGVIGDNTTGNTVIPTKTPVVVPTKTPVVIPTKTPVVVPTKTPVVIPTPTKTPVVIIPTQTPVVIPTKTPIVITDPAKQLDGKLSTFHQGDVPDCGAVSAIQAFDNSRFGKDYLSKVITVNGDGTYTLNFGSGKQTITQKEVDGAPIRGDLDARVIEAGLQKAMNVYSACFASDVFVKMTGFRKNSVSGAATQTSMMNTMESLCTSGEGIIAACDFEIADNNLGILGSGSHSYSIKSVSKDTVVVVNPWDTSKDIKMPRTQFENSIRYMANVDVAGKKVDVFWK